MTSLPECQRCGKPVMVKRLELLTEKGPVDLRDRHCVPCWRDLIHQAYCHAYGIDAKGIGGDEANPPSR